MIRVFDVLISLLVLIIFSPLLFIVAVLILIGSGFPVFFRQIRVGKNGKDFYVYKFRSMRKYSEKMGQITIGERDPRVTPIGYFLRKYKLDELPQFWNVLAGEMSIVGPRPEVRKYVNLYTEKQLKVLQVKPGITDDATIKFRNENEIISKFPDPEKAYIDEVLPIKLSLSQTWIDKRNISNYFRIIWQTFLAIFNTKKL